LELQDFLTKVNGRPLPNNPMARIRTLAKELAEGAAEGVWGASISTFRGSVNEAPVQRYLTERWHDDFPHLALLINNDYLKEGTNELYITKDAFSLLEDVEPASIFISYRREDSSALALLVLARLKAAGLNAFLDLAIQPGRNWRAHIREEIKAREYLILLVGQHTLTSEVVREEIDWALEASATIIPIWHNRFAYKPGEIDLPPEIDRVLKNTHTIRVLEESALAYNNAIIELLNRFGITP